MRTFDTHLRIFKREQGSLVPHTKLAMDNSCEFLAGLLNNNSKRTKQNFG